MLHGIAYPISFLEWIFQEKVVGEWKGFPLRGSCRGATDEVGKHRIGYCMIATSSTASGPPSPPGEG